MPTRLSRLLRTGALAGIAAVQLYGCVPAPKTTPAAAPIRAPAPAPPPRPTSAPAPVPAATSWLDFPRTPGDWHYQATADGSAALYGSAGDTPFSVLCHRGARTVELVRQGSVAGPQAMVVRTTIRDGAVTGQPTSSGTQSVSATLAAADPLLDTMAFSRGRFGIEVAGLANLYLPAWPELARTIEDCR